MTEQQRMNGAGPEELTAPPDPVGGTSTAAEKARNRMKWGMFFGVCGLMLGVLSFLGMAAVADKDFPFVRLIALLLLLLLVGCVGATARGFYTVIEALVALAKLRR